MKDKYPLLALSNPRSCTAGKIMRCERIILNIYRKHLSPFGITSSQLSILMIVAKLEPLKQADLAMILQMEKSTVSRNIRRLLDTNLLMRVVSKQLSVTEEGKILLEKVMPAWENAKAETNELLQADGAVALNLVLNNLSAKH
ncbi:MAG: MarR family winged helix-turn-helix transcriptional regulator [Chitinophagales bacterium]